MQAGAAEPRFSAEERAALARGLAQWNARLFYECHDTLEEVWAGLRGDERAFVQGLIQAAVAFYHLGNGNRPGALSLMGRSLARLSPFPARYAAVELAPLRAELEEWRRALEAGAGLPGEPPRIVIAPEEAA